MQSSSPAVGRLHHERLTPDQWVALVEADERQAVRELQRGRNRSSLLDYYDAANEDSEGRLPHEAGYEGRWAREARQAREAGVPEPQMTRVMALLLEGADEDFEQLVMQYAEAA